MMYRDLEKVRVIIKNAIDLDVAYAYDDLVFPDHTAFIFQYDDDDENSYTCHFHEDCDPNEKDDILKKLIQSAKNEKCSVVLGEIFNLEQKGENVEIKFLKP